MEKGPSHQFSGTAAWVNTVCSSHLPVSPGHLVLSAQRGLITSCPELMPSTFLYLDTPGPGREVQGGLMGAPWSCISSVVMATWHCLHLPLTMTAVPWSRGAGYSKGAGSRQAHPSSGAVASGGRAGHQSYGQLWPLGTYSQGRL